jgi:hypothetical protein
MMFADIEAPETDPALVMPDLRDPRSVCRAERRRNGFRGPLFVEGAPSLARFIRRHAKSVEALPLGSLTRRQRKQVARIKRLVAARGLS